MPIAVDLGFAVACAVWLGLAFRPAATRASFATLRGSLRWGFANGLILAAIVVGFLAVNGWPEVPADLAFMIAYPLLAVFGFVMLALLFASRR